MNNMHRRLICLCFVLVMFAPLQAADATTRHISKQDAYRMLQLGHHDLVRSLPAGEREILLATLAMNQGKTTAALKYLNSKKLKNNQLASLIKAEAYRRQSVRAADRAGHYAHVVNNDIGTLKKARITTGLDKANLRLNAFLVRLNAPEPVPSAPMAKFTPIEKSAQVATFTPLKNSAQMAKYTSIETSAQVAKYTPIEKSSHVVIDTYNTAPIASPVKLAVTKPLVSARVGEAVAVKPMPVLAAKPIAAPQPTVALQPTVIALVQPVAASKQVVNMKVITAKTARIEAEAKPVRLESKQDRVVAESVQIETNAVSLKLAQLASAKTTAPRSTAKRKPLFSSQHLSQPPASLVQYVDRSESVRQAVEAWRKDWTSLDSKAYLKHYDKAFKTLKYDYSSWARYKRRVNGKKTYIKVSVADLKIIPSSSAMQNGGAVLVTFKQRYQSSNYNAVSRKQLYMARKDKSSPWLILYEGDDS